jgi:CRP-like cAMP-binding protein
LRDRLTILEQKLEQVLADRDRLLEKRLQTIEAKLQSDRPQIDDGLTSHQLAEVLGVDRSTISRWKQKGDPRLDAWELKDGKWYKQS